MFRFFDGLLGSSSRALIVTILLTTTPVARSQDLSETTSDSDVLPSISETVRVGQGTTTEANGPCVHTADEPCITPRTIRDLQNSLKALGYNAGPADGLFGPRTNSALNEFRASRGVPPSNSLKLNEAFAVIRTAGQISDLSAGVYVGTGTTTADTGGAFALQRRPRRKRRPQARHPFRPAYSLGLTNFRLPDFEGTAS